MRLKMLTTIIRPSAKTYNLKIPADYINKNIEVSLKPIKRKKQNSVVDFFQNSPLVGVDITTKREKNQHKDRFEF
ncbi:MAG: hypothetical protein DRQ51_03695 [Gammaproteobacteria bacterium]|nr:MAG: hypothetical protein DRQ51_03695 [Gammaproteobacteria bacterium]